MNFRDILRQLQMGGQSFGEGVMSGVASPIGMSPTGTAGPLPQGGPLPQNPEDVLQAIGYGRKRMGMYSVPPEDPNAALAFVQDNALRPSNRESIAALTNPVQPDYEQQFNNQLASNSGTTDPESDQMVKQMKQRMGYNSRNDATRIGPQAELDAATAERQGEPTLAAMMMKDPRVSDLLKREMRMKAAMAMGDGPDAEPDADPDDVPVGTGLIRSNGRTLTTLDPGYQAAAESIVERGGTTGPVYGDSTTERGTSKGGFFTDKNDQTYRQRFMEAQERRRAEAQAIRQGKLTPDEMAQIDIPSFVNAPGIRGNQAAIAAQIRSLAELEKGKGTGSEEFRRDQGRRDKIRQDALALAIEESKNGGPKPGTPEFDKRIDYWERAAGGVRVAPADDPASKPVPKAQDYPSVVTGVKNKGLPVKDRDHQASIGSLLDEFITEANKGDADLRAAPRAAALREIIAGHPGVTSNSTLPAWQRSVLELVLSGKATPKEMADAVSKAYWDRDATRYPGTGAFDEGTASLGLGSW